MYNFLLESDNNLAFDRRRKQKYIFIHFFYFFISSANYSPASMTGTPKARLLLLIWTHFFSF